MNMVKKMEIDKDNPRKIRMTSGDHANSTFGSIAVDFTINSMHCVYEWKINFISIDTACASIGIDSNKKI